MKNKILSMKNFALMFFAGFAVWLPMQILAQSVTATYSDGNIPSNDGFFSASCNGASTPLSVTIPAGANVTGVDVSYTINTPLGGGIGSAWTVEQRSRLRYLNNNIAENGPESGFFACSSPGSGSSGDCGTNVGVTNYSRMGLNIANGITPSGVMNFGLEVYGIYPNDSQGCSEEFNFVPNSSWSITVYYESLMNCSGVPNPGNTLSTVANPCLADGFTLSLQNNTTGNGVSYQWQTSPDGSSWSNAFGAPNAATWILNHGTPTWYRCVVSCSASGESSASNGLLVGISVCYCTPEYVFGKEEGDLISQVTIPGTTLNNISGTLQQNPAYTFFTGSPNYTANLVQGGTYNVTVSVGIWGEQAIHAWIDYNNDGFFDDTESIGHTVVAPGLFNSGPFPPAVFTIVLANNAPLGTRRMRIRSVYGENSADLNPCQEYFFGETEDYDITIVAPTLTQLGANSCNATNVGFNQALFAALVGAPAYRFRISGANNANWVNNTVIVDRDVRWFKFNPQITGEIAGETYNVQVAVGDGFGNFGPYGNACTVTLAELAAQPTTQLSSNSCNAVNVFPSKALFANQVQEAQGYRFRIVGSNNGDLAWDEDTIVVTRPVRWFRFDQHVPGFVPGSTYQVRVAYLTNDGVTYSPYGAMCEVTVAAPFIKPINTNNDIFVDNKTMNVVEFGANASHNPFTTDFGIQVLNANDSEAINVVIYDMSGKLIERNAVNPMDIESARFGANLASGMYTIEVRQGSNQAVIRQVKN